MRELIKSTISFPLKCFFNSKTKRLWTNSESEKAFVKNRYVLTHMPQFPYIEEKIDYSRDAYDFIRIYSLELIANQINTAKVEGSVAELGVNNGAFAKKINTVFPKRKLFLFDTFEGFPDEDLNFDKEQGYDPLDQDFSNTSEAIVLAKMPNPKNCVIRKGYFPATSEGLEDEKYAFVNIDTDLYPSIYDGLKYFYPRLEKGGVIFVHDYNSHLYKGAKQAVDTFINESSQRIPLVPLPDSGGTCVITKL